MAEADKPLAWLKGEIHSPPFSKEARVEAGTLLRRLQRGETLGLPVSRPLPSIGPRCYELRVRDRDHHWSILCRTDQDAIVIIDVFPKRTAKTAVEVIEKAKARLGKYDKAARGEQ